MPVAAGLVEIARDLAADRGLDGGVDVAGREVVARRTFAIDIDADGRLTQERRQRDVGDAGNRFQHAPDVGGDLLQRLQIRATDLDGVFGVYARGRLLHVVLDVLGEG